VYEGNQIKLEYELALLESRKDKLKPQWLVEKELRLRCIDAAIEQVSLSILELETHKAALQKQAEPDIAMVEQAAEVQAVAVEKPRKIRRQLYEPYTGASFHPAIVRLNGFRSG